MHPYGLKALLSQDGIGSAINGPPLPWLWDTVKHHPYAVHSKEALVRIMPNAGLVEVNFMKCGCKSHVPAVSLSQEKIVKIVVM